MKRFWIALNLKYLSPLCGITTVILFCGGVVFACWAVRGVVRLSANYTHGTQCTVCSCKAIFLSTQTLYRAFAFMWFFYRGSTVHRNEEVCILGALNYTLAEDVIILS